MNQEFVKKLLIISLALAIYFGPALFMVYHHMNAGWWLLLGWFVSIAVMDYLD